jgi:hypothetical protein
MLAGKEAVACRIQHYKNHIEPHGSIYSCLPKLSDKQLEKLFSVEDSLSLKKIDAADNIWQFNLKQQHGYCDSPSARWEAGLQFEILFDGMSQGEWEEKNK